MASNEQLWQVAKKKCRLNNEDIEIAKRLGISPKGLMKNIPNPNQKWKAPVKVWLHELDEQQKKKAAKKQQRKENKTKD